jgi:HAD superfamily hydrolase (TIGR01549 family)
MRRLEAISFDFGNTLVPFPAAPMADVVRLTAERASRHLGLDADEFIRVWAEERSRQFAQEVPEGREADMDVRAARVLARLRGQPSPLGASRWDDRAAARCSTPDEVASILDAYAGFFVESTPVPPEIEPLLARLHRRYKLAIVSNWPLAIAVERFLASAGWSVHLDAIVVSHRIGVIKPRAAIFEAAARQLGVLSGPGILHVGDDIGADVVGAHGVGWRAALVRVKPEDSPLPTARPAPDESPDIVVDSVLDLEAALGLRPAPATS